MKKKPLMAGALILLSVVTGVVLSTRKSACVPAEDVPSDARAVRPPSAIPERKPAADGGRAKDATEAGDGADEGASGKTPEELKEEEEEALVEAFDALTDKWMEPSGKGVAMSDVDAFAAQFGKVPPERREECLQRALNLVPDENVMLLAGILMDKSLPKDLAGLVFNDVLNRDEEVKKPILRQIFRDKSHPCHAEAAWILDVTGEIPD